MAYDFNSLTKQADEAINRDGFYTDFEDVDPNKLHQISELTDWMRTKAKGSDVREVIAQLFERTWLEESKEGNANIEVAKARGRFPVLNDRLNNADMERAENAQKLAQKANKDEVTNVMTPKGTLAYASLPPSGNQVGWYYYCPDGDGVHGAGNYVWNGTSWYFGGTGDEGYNLLKKDLAELDNAMTHEYLENIPFTINVGCFSKVGWKFYTDSWATGYNYARLEVVAGQKYTISSYGNANAQAVMFFSGEPSQETYVNGIGETEQTYINYEITVPDNVTVMLVQTMPHKTPISIEKNVKYTLPKAIKGKMYWEVKDGELTVVSKYDSNRDLVVKFGKRGPNDLPDFKSFSTRQNSNIIPSNGLGATEFIGNVTDWHSPFQIRAVTNADGDKGTNYNYTGGNHNYNNGSASGDGLATARCSNLTFVIDGVETAIGSGYSSDIKAKWTNYVQANNTIKADGTGREVLKEHHELVFDNCKFISDGYIELLESIHIDQYYGYQIYGLNSETAFDSSIRFIGASNRGSYTDISVAHESGNADCNGIEAVGTNHSCRLTIDTSYDLGKRTMYDGAKGCFNTQYQKAYINLIGGKYGLPTGNRYYSRAVWEFYPTTD